MGAQYFSHGRKSILKAVCLCLFTAISTALMFSCSEKNAVVEEPVEPQNPTVKACFHLIYHEFPGGIGVWTDTLFNLEDGIDIDPEKLEFDLLGHYDESSENFPFYIEWKTNEKPWLAIDDRGDDYVHLIVTDWSIDKPQKATGVFLIDGIENRFEIRLRKMENDDNLIPLLGTSLSRQLINKGYGNESKIVRQDLQDVDTIIYKLPIFSIIKLFPSLKFCELSFSNYRKYTETIVIDHPILEELYLGTDSADIIIDCPQLKRLGISSKITSYIGRHPKIEKLSLGSLSNKDGMEADEPIKFDLGECPLLNDIYLWGFSFEEYDFSRFPALKNLHIQESPRLKYLDLSPLNNLKEFEAYHCGLEDIKLHRNLSSTTISLQYNNLRKLEIPAPSEIEYSPWFYLYLEGNPGENGVFPIYLEDETFRANIVSKSWEYEGKTITVKFLKKGYRAPAATLTGEPFTSKSKWRKAYYRLDYSDFGSPKQNKYTIYAAKTPHAGSDNYIWKDECEITYGDGNFDWISVEDDDASRIYICAELQCEYSENNVIRTNEVAVELAPIQEPAGLLSDISATHNSAKINFGIESNPEITDMKYFCSETENYEAGIAARSAYDGVLYFADLSPETHYYVHAVGKWREDPITLTLGEFTTKPEPEQEFNIKITSIYVAQDRDEFVGQGLQRHSTRIEVEASYEPYLNDVEVYFETPGGDRQATSVSYNSFSLSYSFDWYYTLGATVPSWSFRAVIIYKGKKHYSPWRSVKA